MKILNYIRKGTLLFIAGMASAYTLLYILSLDNRTCEQIIHGGIIALVCGIYLNIFVYANYKE